MRRSRREMKWEREDRILETDWEPGDYQALAVRYAGACHRVPAWPCRRRPRRNGCTTWRHFRP